MLSLHYFSFIVRCFFFPGSLSSDQGKPKTLDLCWGPVLGEGLRDLHDSELKVSQEIAPRVKPK